MAPFCSIRTAATRRNRQLIHLVPLVSCSMLSRHPSSTYASRCRTCMICSGLDIPFSDPRSPLLLPSHRKDMASHSSSSWSTSHDGLWKNRTSDFPFMRRTLSPSELRAHISARQRFLGKTFFIINAFTRDDTALSLFFVQTYILYTK